MRYTTICLGGGGVIGLAWLNGLISGLGALSVDLRAGSHFLGTSAGAIGASLLAQGFPPEKFANGEILQAFWQDTVTSLQPDWNIARQLFDAYEAGSPSKEELQKICFSLEEKQAKRDDASSERFIKQLSSSLPLRELWPENLDICVFEAKSAGVAAKNHQSNFPLHLALAASISIPGVFPVHCYEDGLYADGGLLSLSNTALLPQKPFEFALIILPIALNSGNLGRFAAETLAVELKSLEERQIPSLVISFDELSQQRIGDFVLDASRAPIAYQEGRRQAAELEASSLSQLQQLFSYPQTEQIA